MSRRISVREETLAKVAAVVCQKLQSPFPGSRIEPLDLHYTDEDLTLEVRVPLGADVRKASDEFIKLAPDAEDQFGVAILMNVVVPDGS